MEVMKAIRAGVDIGGTTVKIALLDSNREILIKTAIPTKPEEGFEAVFRRIAEAVKDCMAQLGQEDLRLESVGVCSPGIMSDSGQTIEFASNLGFEHVHAVREMEKYFTCPVRLANDADAAALGEHFCGAGKGHLSTVTVTVGTGIGSGIILRDHIWPGAFHGGGEVGHHIIVARGRKCGCGQEGCMERYASSTALIEGARERAEKDPTSRLHALCGGDLSKLDAKMVCDARDEGDTAATEAFDEFVEYLAIGLINVIDILQPEVLIIGGGISAQKDKLIEPLRKYIGDHLLFGWANFKTELTYATLGNDAGVIGASLLED